MNKRLLVLMISIAFLLGGCVSALDSFLEGKSPEMVLTKAEEAHGELESVEVSFEEDHDEFTDTGLLTIDIKNGVSFITLEEDDVSIYIDDSNLLVEYPDKEVESFTDTGLFADLEDKVEFEKNPIAYYKGIDDEIFSKFEMEKEKEQYILTYNGTEEEKQYLGKAISFYEMTGLDDFDESIDFQDLTIDSYDLKLVIDSSSYLLEKIEQEITYQFEDDPTETVTKTVHAYGSYDDIGEIEALEATIEDGEGLNKGNENAGKLSKEDKKLYEKEASAYVDALIQATVFQNAEGFIEKAPDSISKEDKKEEGELQRDFFKEMYIENTQNNMEGTGVTEEEVLDLTDAFLQALATTKYEVVKAEASTPEDIAVTVSIEGFDDTKIYKDTEDQLYEVFTEEDISEDEIISKNMEILIQNYKDIDSLLDPVEVDVDVTREENGSYMVMMQDQYLVGGFVQ